MSKVRRIALGTSSTTAELSVADNEAVSSWVVQFSGTVGTMSITPKGYVKGSPDLGAALSSSDASGLAYYVGSTGVLTASSTPISTAGVYRIIADGCSVVLDYTAGGGSSPVVHARPLRG